MGIKVEELNVIRKRTLDNAIKTISERKSLLYSTFDDLPEHFSDHVIRYL